VIDLETRTVVGKVKVGKRPYAVALAKGLAFVTDQYEDTVSVFDVASLEPVARIPVNEYPEGIAASRDGSHVYVANWETNTLSIIDTETLKVVGEVPVADGPRAFGAFIRRTD
jgi:YVTN family beta-propeller protein